VTLKNPRYLNAEDQTTIDATEIGIDLATLDPQSSIAVLRGGEVEHVKYRGRRILAAASISRISTVEDSLSLVHPARAWFRA